MALFVYFVLRTRKKISSFLLLTQDLLCIVSCLVQGRTNHNKVACALANKLIGISYATLLDGEEYGAAQRLNYWPLEV